MDSYKDPAQIQHPSSNSNNSQTTLYDLPLDVLYMFVDHLNYYDAVDFCVAYLSPIYDQFLKEKKCWHSTESKETKVKEFSGQYFKLFSNCRKKLEEIKLTAGSFSTCLSIPDKNLIVWGSFKFRMYYEKLNHAYIKTLIECHKRVFVILRDNTVYAFGENNFNELGLSVSGWITPTQILKNKKIIKITTGYKHTLFLSQSGEVFSTGSNDHKQLGFPYIFFKSTPTMIQVDEKIIDIVAGSNHSLILTEKGEVLGCGSNDMGQLGKDHEFMEKCFKKITVPGFVIQAAAGYAHSIFLNSKGEVYFCGNNKFEPFQIESFKNKKIVAITASEDSSYFLTEDGEVYKLINKLDSQSNCVEELSLIELPERIHSISAGFGHLAFLSRSGNIYTLGTNSYGQLGYDTNGQIQELPRKVELPTKTQTPSIMQKNKELEKNDNNNNNTDNKRQKLF